MTLREANCLEQLVGAWNEYRGLCDRVADTHWYYKIPSMQLCKCFWCGTVLEGSANLFQWIEITSKNMQHTSTQCIILNKLVSI